MAASKKNKLTFLLLILFMLPFSINLQAQVSYRVLKVHGQITQNGKVIKKGGVFIRGSKIRTIWPQSGNPWIHATRKGKTYSITRNGIKEISHHSTDVQLTETKYLIHRGFSFSDADSIIHYSNQNYYLIGKNDFLLFERKSKENNVLVEAVSVDTTINLRVPINLTENERYYVITPVLFKRIKPQTSVKIYIHESKDDYIYDDYRYGLEIHYLK